MWRAERAASAEGARSEPRASRQIESGPAEPTRPRVTWFRWRRGQDVIGIVLTSGFATGRLGIASERIPFL